jgi:uncharacterized protein YhbP (UPF0306 family)
MSANVEELVRDYIDDSLHLSLATVRENRPWVSELHYAYDDDLNLYFCSLPSRRHSQELVDNPFVSGNIVKQYGAHGEAVHGLYFEGRARMVDESDCERVFEVFKRRQDVPESLLEESKRPDGHKFYQIVVSDWYVFGKIDGDKSEKLHLPWPAPVAS